MKPLPVLWFALYSREGSKRPHKHLHFQRCCSTWANEQGICRSQERSCALGVPPAFAGEPCVLERLEAVLQPIMWRNDKISVGDELKLPPRTLDVSLLNVPHPIWPCQP